MKLPISPKHCFLKIYFSHDRKGENHEAEKMFKLKLVRILVKRFDKFHDIWATATFLISVLLCHNLDSSMLK